MQSAAPRCPILNWLPPARDFRGELADALANGSAVDRLEQLAKLAGHRLGFLETVHLDRALGGFNAKAATGFLSIRLAVLASGTVDHLLPAMRVAGLRRRMLIDVHHGAYGQYRRDLLEPSAGLVEFAPQTILFSLTAREVVAGIRLAATSDEVDDAIAKFVAELRSLWTRARAIGGAEIVQQTFLDVGEPLFGSYDRFVPAAPARIVARLNDRLCEAAAQDGVLLLDIARASERDGIDAWFETGSWLQGKLEIAPQAAPMYGELLARLLAARRGLSKKCLVLDLDNTLWGGVIGDDGIDGIVLGQGSAVGEAHLALQQYAWQLRERGIILAVCSKNDATVAEAAFREHPEMLLRRSDIAAFLANWDDKAANLRAIAARLNIGLDSLVFVDDSPVERARVRQSLPMVAVPELPDDVAHYVRCIASAGYFEATAFTAEDRDRPRQYAENAERETLLEAAQSMDEFLSDLQMSVVFGPFMAVDHQRIVQLINKTNQFNTTTRRYSSEEITKIASLPRALTLQFRLIDRIGDNGLVSTMILRPTVDCDNVLEIENWVMSCRVFGRQLESAAMNLAVEATRRHGAQAIVADYIATPKNGVIRTLYPDLGFTEVASRTAGNGATRWFLDLGDYVMRPHHIACIGAHNDAAGNPRSVHPHSPRLVAG